MSGIYIFTAGNSLAREHLATSITNDIPLDNIKNSFTPEEIRVLRKMAQSENGLYAWGAVTGKRNIPTWESLRQNDYVLTVFDKTYQFVSKVLWKTHNREAAKTIWGLDDKGDTWEYMYFLSKPRPVQVHASAVESELNKSYQGFWKISEDKIQKLTRRFGSTDTFIESKFGEKIADRYIPSARKDDAASKEADTTFSPTDTEDAREKVLRSIAVRQGQPKFRRELLATYGRECAVTGCDVVEALEAAHILPYNGDTTNHVQNGILLRADIHTLYDLGIIEIDEHYIVHLYDGLGESSYQQYDGVMISLPKDVNCYPSVEAIKQRNS